jgi:glycosyltransferase involved in cell wall biosynthesis/protein-tyrosine-phosphatase
MTARASAVQADLTPVPMPAPATLRVCHVMSADLWAGAEVQVATTAEYLVRQPGVSVSAVLFNDGPLAAELRRLGVPVMIVDERQTSAIGILRRLTRFFKEQQIDLVHTHRYKDSVLGALAAKMAGVPNVVRTVHGLREPMSGWNTLKFRLYEALERAVLLCFADLVIAVSRGMADTLRRSGYRPTSVTQIHNGINLEAIAAHRSRDEVLRQLGIDPAAFVIGTAGRLSPVKGHAGLLRAVRQIRQARPGTICVLVGGGPLEEELRAEAARLGIAEACRFTGAREDVHDLVGAMDVFVLPSLSEGIPMALLEAMALGRPVVASAVGGVPEVIQDGVNGLLVPAGDDRLLAAACVRLSRDRTYAQTLAARARRFVEERFCHERSGRALLAAYRSVALIPKNKREEHENREAHEVKKGLRELRPHRDLRVWNFSWGSARLLAGRVANRMARWRAARAMTRVRRNPEPIQARLRAARNVLIVCHGNIIRSAFAGRLVKEALNGTGAARSIHSAGLEAVAGRAADPMALRAAQARGIDLGGHTAARVTSEQVAGSDIIFVMDVDQVVTMRRRFVAAADRTFLLTCLAPAIPMEIRDPYDGDAGQFHRCFDQISRAVRPIVQALNTPRDPAPPTGDQEQPGLRMRRAW